MVAYTLASAPPAFAQTLFAVVEHSRPVTELDGLPAGSTGTRPTPGLFPPEAQSFKQLSASFFEYRPDALAHLSSPL